MTKQVYIDAAVLPVVSSLCSLYSQYEALLSRLHVEELPTNAADLYGVMYAPQEILITVLCDRQLVATGQGSCVDVIPNRLLLVSNLVTHDDYEGQGYGSTVLAALEREAVRRWSSPHRQLRAVLTNRPARGNSAFYERQGWYPLTPDTPDMTRLWQKDLC